MPPQPGPEQARNPKADAKAAQAYAKASRPMGYLSTSASVTARSRGKFTALCALLLLVSLGCGQEDGAEDSPATDDRTAGNVVPGADQPADDDDDQDDQDGQGQKADQDDAAGRDDDNDGGRDDGDDDGGRDDDDDDDRDDDDDDRDDD